MAKSIPSPFCGVEFSSPAELFQSQVILTNQRDWIQYNISLLAMERLSLPYDPQNPVQFAQQEAELKGKIGILQYLLDSSDSAQDSLKALQTPDLNS